MPWPPDWKSPKNYPAQNATSIQWAWEFLRRNPEYQRHWAKLIKRRYRAADLDASWRESERVRPRQRTRHSIKISRKPFWKKFSFTDPPPPPLDVFRREFHVQTYPPPPWEDQAKLAFDAQFIPYEGVGNNSRAVTRPLNLHEIVVWFNVTWPLTQQLQNVKSLLTKRARLPGPRRRVNQYQKYLRLLDAEAASADTKQICSILYPKLSDAENARQRVRDDLKAAEQLRDRDFWLIAVAAKK